MRGSLSWRYAALRAFVPLGVYLCFGSFSQAAELPLEPSVTSSQEAPKTPESEADASPEQATDPSDKGAQEAWKTEVDAFLADYLPPVPEAQRKVTEPESPFVFDLPPIEAIAPESEFPDADRFIKDPFTFMSPQAQALAAKDKHIGVLDDKVLNRWVLPFGLSPEQRALAIELRLREEKRTSDNRQLVKGIELYNKSLSETFEDELKK